MSESLQIGEIFICAVSSESDPDMPSKQQGHKLTHSRSLTALKHVSVEKCRFFSCVERLKQKSSIKRLRLWQLTKLPTFPQNNKCHDRFMIVNYSQT